MSAARDAQAAVGSGFATGGDGARWTCTGDLTSANAGPVLAAAAALKLPGAGEVDLTAVEGIDSAALYGSHSGGANGFPARFISTSRATGLIRPLGGSLAAPYATNPGTTDRAFSNLCSSSGSDSASICSMVRAWSTVSLSVAVRRSAERWAPQPSF